MNIGLFKTVTIITGVLVAGEALALLAGMYFLSPRPNAWISALHTGMIILDILCGAGLIILILLKASSLRNGLLLTTGLVSFAAHIYREWEYLASPTANRFLTNTPLFVVNNVKLIGLILIAGILIHFT